MTPQALQKGKQAQQLVQRKGIIHTRQQDMELQTVSQRRPPKVQLQLLPQRQLGVVLQTTIVVQTRLVVRIVQVQHHVHGVNLVANVLMEIGMDPPIAVTGDGSSARLQENIF